MADFGLSVSMGEDKDYFRLSDSGNEKLPVKWMAVESIIDYKFSEATDVVRLLLRDDVQNYWSTIAQGVSSMDCQQNL